MKMEAIIIDDDDPLSTEANLDLDWIRKKAGIRLILVSATAFILIASTSGYLFYLAKECDKEAKDGGVMGYVILSFESMLINYCGIFYGILAIFPMVLCIVCTMVVRGKKYRECRSSAIAFMIFLGPMVILSILGYLIAAQDHLLFGVILSSINITGHSSMIGFTLRSFKDMKLSRESFDKDHEMNEEVSLAIIDEREEGLPRFRIISRSEPVNSFS